MMTASRTKSILRSRQGDHAVTNNYEDTCQRIDDAVALLANAQGNTRDATIIAVRSADDYLTECEQWYARLQFIDELIEMGGVESDIQLQPLKDIAEKMTKSSGAQSQVWRDRVIQLGNTERDLQDRVDQLKSARSQLKLAQSLVDSRRKLESLASSAVFSGESSSSEGSLALGSVDLRQITALAREAEALAELKGWSV